MKIKLKEVYWHAVRLRDQGDYSSAKDLLIRVHKANPESPAVMAVLADVCWDMKQLDQAISLFRQASFLRPSSDIVSVSLFHTLFEAGYEEDAFSEMKRFLAEYESEEYSQLLAEITADLEADKRNRNNE